MKEASFIVFKDENGCVAAEVINIDRFNSPTGVARAINNSRQHRKTGVQFIGKKNALSKKEIKEAEKILNQ